MSDCLAVIHVLKGVFEVNCYIGWCANTREAFIIDPGAVANSELSEIMKVVNENKLAVKYIVNTHGHLDHIGGNTFVFSKTKCRILIHDLDKEMLINTEKNGSNLFGLAVRSPPADIYLKHNQTIFFGDEQLKVLHTPGHTEGCICLYWQSKNTVFTGDTLFAGSIGRTDLPGGSLEQEINSIKTQLLVLPGDTIVLPGHGSSSTVSNEKNSNPFLT